MASNPHGQYCQCAECFFWREAKEQARDTATLIKLAFRAIESAAKTWEEKAKRNDG